MWKKIPSPPPPPPALLMLKWEKEICSSLLVTTLGTHKIPPQKNFTDNAMHIGFPQNNDAPNYAKTNHLLSQMMKKKKTFGKFNFYKFFHKK